MSEDALISSLGAAVEAAPEDVPLRVHLAELLLTAGRSDEAIQHAAAALAVDPGARAARDVMQRAMSPGAGGIEPEPSPGSAVPGKPPAQGGAGFDWKEAEQELGEVAPPMFADDSQDDTEEPAYDVERVGVRLADVGGLKQVKDRLNASFLAPLNNPQLRKLYGKSLRGGLLLYGPPGCGKTFLAKAVAGELGAQFLHVSVADVFDMYIGNTERNLHELFETARSSAPCVLFLDELDALGVKRTLTRNSGTRTSVNQLLTELDGVGSENEGVYVLAATNHPWDVDPALRRPGRLDRMLLVLPPDQEAREAIFRTHLRDRPIASIDTKKLAKRTDGFSGADIAHVVDSASEVALLDSVNTGVPRMITMADFEQALGEIRPSIGAWMETARNVALFANANGEYDELAAYIRKRGRG
ncbi:MAG TPA: AAA family ATPase [Nocardioides sp.]|nr:AAA family ATPase [Nocardioides sp.]